MKCVHNWQPLGDLLHCCEQGCAENCASCGHEVETREHLLQCEHMKSWVTELFRELDAFCRCHLTKQELQDTLKEGLGKWLKGEDDLVQPMGGRCNELLKKQSEVGWDQVLLGRFVNQWKQVQQEHLRTLPLEQRKLSQSGLTWVTGMSKMILNDVCDNWITQCNK